MKYKTLSHLQGKLKAKKLPSSKPALKKYEEDGIVFIPPRLYTDKQIDIIVEQIEKYVDGRDNQQGLYQLKR